MIIHCPTCSQGYDTTGYPDNYKFACSCGAVIDVASLQQKEGGAPYVHPKAPEPLPYNPGPTQTTRTSPPSAEAYPSADLIPGLDQVDLAEREEEATAITQSPYVQTTAQYPSPQGQSQANSPAYALHSGSVETSSTAAYTSNASMDSSNAQIIGSPEAFQQPASWTELPESSIPLPIDDADRTEPRAIWAIILAFFVFLGPLVWILASRARQQIRLSPNIFRGKGLALLGTLVGIAQTIGLFAFFYFATTQPNIHPWVHRGALALGFIKPKSKADQWVNRPSDSETLSTSLAQKLLSLRMKRQGSQASAPTVSYVYQTTAYNAQAYWRDKQRNTSQRGQYFRSLRGHWYLTHIETAYKEETRVSLPGPGKLTATLARQLIKKFWELRGRFTGVHIQYLYVVQKPGKSEASAYWKLQKQQSGKPTKTWVVESRFRRSSDEMWFLVQYAARVPKDELHQYSSTSEPRLPLKLAKNLMARAHKEQKLRFQPRSLAIYQEPNSRTAWALWQNSRRQPPQRSLFRYSNAQKWHLARLKITPAIEVRYRTQSTATLSRTLAQKLLNTYLRKKRKRQRVKYLYVYQRPKEHRAQVRWISQFIGKPKPGTPAPRPQQSLFLYTSGGAWNLTTLRHTPIQEVQFYRKGGRRLSPYTAKQLLRQYWKDKSWKSSSNKFSGLTIRDLFIHQNSPQKAWAHWTFSNKGSDSISRLRSSFYRSQSGLWHLGTYNLGRAFSLKHQIVAPKQLSPQSITPLLKKYLQSRYKSTEAKLSEIYIVKPINPKKAYVHWILQSDKKARIIFSLLHRSNANRWYLSVPELPHPPTQ